MRKKITLLVVTLIALVSVLSLIGCSSSPSSNSAPTTSNSASTTAATAKTLTIGVNAELSGVISAFSTVALVGTKVAAQYINDHGGITVKGQQYNVNLYFGDNKSTADGATAAATDMVSRGIKFVIGGIPNYVTIPINAVTEQNDQFYAPFYDVGTKEEFSANNSKLLYYFNPGSIEAGAAVINYAHKVHPEIKNVSLSLVEASSVGDIVSKYQTITAADGINIIQPVITASDQITDVTPVAQKIMAQNPDAVCLGDGYYQLYILKTLRQMGYTKPIMLCCEVDPLSAQSVAGPQASTNFIGAGISENATDMPEVMKEVVPLIQAASSDHHCTLSRLNFFNPLYTLANVIQAANSVNPDDVAAYLANLGPNGTVKTVFGDAKMGGAQTYYGLNHELQQPIPIQTLENNVLKDVGWTQAYLP